MCHYNTAPSLLFKDGCSINFLVTDVNFYLEMTIVILEVVGMCYRYSTGVRMKDIGRSIKACLKGLDFTCDY